MSIDALNRILLEQAGRINAISPEGAQAGHALRVPGRGIKTAVRPRRRQRGCFRENLQRRPHPSSVIINVISSFLGSGDITGVGF
jgi:hypothetical protein